MAFNTPLRYPGGKGKLTSFLKRTLDQNQLKGCHYVEPYAGGAGLALNLLFEDYVSEIYLNDLNLSIYAFWHSVLYDSNKLIKLINNTPITISEWHNQKKIQLQPITHSLLNLDFQHFF